MQTEEQRRSWERGWVKQKQKQKNKNKQGLFSVNENPNSFSKLGAEFSTFQTNFVVIKLNKFDNNFISFRP